MAFDYARSAATATRLLTNFGQAVTHTNVAEGTYNPATGTFSTTTTNQSAIGVLLEYTTEEAGVIQAAGGLVQANDRKLLLGVSGITLSPVPNDTVTVSGVVYTVIKVRTLKPAATVVMYELHLRR